MPHEPSGAGPDSPAGWSIAGSAGRAAIRSEEADPAARAYWDAEADAYQSEHAEFLGGAAGGFVWGPEGAAEDELELLGPAAGLRGRRVLEVGCGAAQCSRWLAGHGAHAVGIDISVPQLRHAVRATPAVPVVAATATALPFPDGSFDAAFASYGAVQFVADLPALLAEVRRVVRPLGTWAFSVTHPIRWAFPDSPDVDGLTATGSYFDRTPYVERDEDGTAVYAEFHRTLGDYVGALGAAGFTLERLVEPPWPAGNTAVWGGWSPLRGAHLPGTLILGTRRSATG